MLVKIFKLLIVLIAATSLLIGTWTFYMLVLMPDFPWLWNILN